MSNNFFIGCEGLSVGVESLTCLNASAGFILGWGIITVLFFVLWNNLEFEPIKDKVAVISFVLAITSMLLIASGFLPQDAFIYFFLAAIGSSAALVYRR